MEIFYDFFHISYHLDAVGVSVRRKRNELREQLSK